jgi:MYXO-CTERM domain-containing protein
MSANVRRSAGSVRRWRRIITRGAPVVLGLAALDLAAVDARAAELFSQNFEGLALGPFVSSSEKGGDGADWTAELPPGWVRNNTTTPDAGPAEFFGFTFMKKSSWIATEENQERSMFTRGTGTVMVADADAYDDLAATNPAAEIEPDKFNVFIQTPAISLAGAKANTARLNFDSSFRPYDTMTASVEVSFDNGTNFTNLLSMNSANVPGGDSSLARVDEAVSLPLNNPAGATGAIIRFGMTRAGNDWWWALDNIEVTDVVPEPTGAAVLLGAVGIEALRRRRRHK